MDPVSLAVVGLAGNVVQFVDFGCRILAKTRKIHRDGRVVEHKDLQLVTVDLIQYIKKIEEGLIMQQPGLAISEEADLVDIIHGCLDVANELVQALAKLDSGGQRTKWKSLRQALKSVWGKERLTDLKARLDLYSEQMDRRILISLKSLIQAVAVKQEHELKMLDSTTRTLLDRLERAEKVARDHAQILQENDAKIIIVAEQLLQKMSEELGKIHIAVTQSTLDLGHSYTSEHLRTRSVVDAVNMSIISSISSATEVSRQEQIATRAEIESVQRETENQVMQLREEIRQLEIKMEKTVKDAVVPVSGVSSKEQQRLKETRNAKFNLRAAKEIILKTLLDFPALFRANLSGLATAIDPATWNLKAYPNQSPNATSKSLSQLKQISQNQARTLEDGSTVHLKAFDVITTVSWSQTGSPLWRVRLSSGGRRIMRLSAPANLIPSVLDRLSRIFNPRLESFEDLIQRFLMENENLQKSLVVSNRALVESFIANVRIRVFTWRNVAQAETVRFFAKIRHRNLKGRILLLRAELYLSIFANLIVAAQKRRGVSVHVFASDHTSHATLDTNRKSAFAIAAEKWSFDTLSVVFSIARSKLRVGWEWEISKFQHLDLCHRQSDQGSPFLSEVNLLALAEAAHHLSFTAAQSLLPMENGGHELPPRSRTWTGD